MPLLTNCVRVARVHIGLAGKGLQSQRKRRLFQTSERVRQSKSWTRYHGTQTERSKADNLLEALRSNKVTPDYVLETIEGWVNPVGSDAHVGAQNDAVTVFQEIIRTQNLMDEVKTLDRIATTYSYLMHTLLKTDNDADINTRLALADQLRTNMQQLLRTSTYEIRLSARSLSANLLFLCKTGKVDEAHKILSSMIQQVDSGDSAMAPDLICFNTMIHGYANVGAVKEAKELVDLMLSRKKDGKSNVVPDIVSLHGVLHAYAKSSLPDAAEQAEAFLAGISSTPGLAPDTLCYTTIIDIHSKSRLMGAAKKAEIVLKRMLMLAEQGHDVQVDVVAFTAVIDAWSKSGERDSVKHAERLIVLMEMLAASGNSLVAPTVTTYNALINVIAKTKSYTAGSQALGVLQRIRDRGDIEPNEISFNSVISALVYSGRDESDVAMDLLSQMKRSSNCRPTTITYNAVLHVLSRSNRGNSHEMAHSLLCEMKEDPGNGAAPSTITYNTIMQIIAKSSLPDAAERIQKVLDELEANTNLRPSKQSYTTAMSAWARSNSPDKVQRALVLLDRIKAEYATGNQTCKPDIMVYNTLLNCCCFAIGGHEEASQVVIDTFFNLHDSRGTIPDSITYALTMKALGRTMPSAPARESLLKQIFHFACHDGLVDDNVLLQLSRASMTLFHDVVAEHGSDSRGYPKEWSRRVKGGYSRTTPR